MTDRYVWSGATGAGTGVDFANAYTTLVAAEAAASAGDIYKIRSNHQENLAATLQMNGNEAAPDTVFTLNGTTEAYEFMEVGGGYIGSAIGVSMTVRGDVHWNGVYWRPGGGNAQTSGANITFGNTGELVKLNDCPIEMPNSNGVAWGAGGACTLEMENCPIYSAHPNTRMSVGTGSNLIIRNLDELLSVLNNIGILGSGVAGNVIADGVGLANQGSGAQLFATSVSTNRDVILRACTVHSSINIPTPITRTDRTDLIACTDQTGATRNERIRYTGRQTHETTVFRTGGANDGNENFSWKIVTTANATRQMPFESFEETFYVSAGQVGTPVTATVHVVTDGITLTDAEAWLEVLAATTATVGILTGYSDKVASPVATPANQTASLEAWTTTDLASPVYQKLEVTFTPTREGPHKFRVCAGRASTTLYACPKVEIT